VSPPGPWPDLPQGQGPLLQKVQALKIDTKTNHPGRTCADSAVHIENEPQLIERLQAFGLIESNGKGGWQVTECCETGLAKLACNTDAPPKTEVAAVIRPWKPRALVWSDIR
jgi:hypothetical protein